MTKNEKARDMADEVLSVLKHIVMSEHEDAAVRVAAGKEILARGLGAAPSVEIVEQTLKVAET